VTQLSTASCLEAWGDSHCLFDFLQTWLQHTCLQTGKALLRVPYMASDTACQTIMNIVWTQVLCRLPVSQTVSYHCYRCRWVLLPCTNLRCHRCWAATIHLCCFSDYFQVCCDEWSS